MTKSPSVIPEISEETRRQALGMYLAGFQSCEISERTGINGNTLRSWSKRDEWPKLKAELEARHAEKNPVSEMPLAKAVSRRGEYKEKFIEKTGVMAADDADYWADMHPQERLEVAQNIASLGGFHRKSLDLDSEKDTGQRGHISLTFLTAGPEAVRELKQVNGHEV